MELAVTRAEARLGIRGPDDLLEEARKLTAPEMEVEGFPAYYEEMLLEDTIVETCFMAAINGRY